MVVVQGESGLVDSADSNAIDCPMARIGTVDYPASHCGCEEALIDDAGYAFTPGGIRYRKLWLRARRRVYGFYSPVCVKTIDWIEIDHWQR